MHTLFAVTAPGLEALAAQELSRLGLLPAKLHLPQPGAPALGPQPGGVVFQGWHEQLYKANLHLRTASRVLIRLGEFDAKSFPELRKKAARLPWERFLAPGQPVSVHAASHKSRLYHSDAVAERVAYAIADNLGKAVRLLKPQPEAASPPPLVVVRLVRDHCTISLDSSGELLHRRGYRQAVAKAPLRETLAAAMLLASGWDPAAPLLDPFCGSGTIAIEAALLALGRPPGCKRRFAFMDWPSFENRRWDALRAACHSQTCSGPPRIQASDRDAGAVEMAQANAERAGVAACIEFTQRAVSAIQPLPGPGWVVTNPPYGLRVSATQDIRNLYAQLGNVLRIHCPGWKVGILSNDVRLLSQTRLKLDTSLAMVNGGVNVRLGLGVVEEPAGEP